MFLPLETNEVCHVKKYFIKSYRLRQSGFAVFLSMLKVLQKKNDQCVNFPDQMTESPLPTLALQKPDQRQKSPLDLS